VRASLIDLHLIRNGPDDYDKRTVLLESSASID